MSDAVFQRYSAYYDLLYRDKNYPAEADYVGRTLRSASPHTRSVLEFGSGSGGHGILLAQKGFEVFGVERSASMVNEARRAAGSSKMDVGSFDCTTGDVRSVNLKRSFDAVIALFHVVSYQTTNDDVLATFESASRHLPAGGIFLFDVWHGPAVYEQRPSVRIKRVENDAIRLTRVAEPDFDMEASTVTVRYTMLAESKSDQKLETFGEEHRMRFFFRTDIDLFARQTGFQLERSEEYLTGKAPNKNTWGVAYILRKIK